MKHFIFLLLFLVGCGRHEVAQPHLHNYPFLGDCPSLEEKHIDKETELKAHAKALNMRYVDYLHALANGKVQLPAPQPSNKNIGLNE